VACGLALIAALRLGREATPAPEMADMASSRADH
jgi:hypothetical protein